MASCGGSTEDSIPVETKQEKEIIKDYDYYLKRIAEDEEWMKIVEKEAEESGISMDSALRKDAKHWAETKIKQ